MRLLSINVGMPRRTGVCHRCETALMTGAVNYAPSPIDLPGDGNLLICCSQPQGDIVVDL
jgi:hypothetical protein